MTIKKILTPSDEDNTRRAFSPIHMDLVERLTREADTRASHLPCAFQARSGDTNKMAA